MRYVRVLYEFTKNVENLVTVTLCLHYQLPCCMLNVQNNDKMRIHTLRQRKSTTKNPANTSWLLVAGFRVKYAIDSDQAKSAHSVLGTMLCVKAGDFLYELYVKQNNKQCLANDNCRQCPCLLTQKNAHSSSHLLDSYEKNRISIFSKNVLNSH